MHLTCKVRIDLRTSCFTRLAVGLDLLPMRCSQHFGMCSGSRRLACLFRGLGLRQSSSSRPGTLFPAATAGAAKATTEATATANAEKTAAAATGTGGAWGNNDITRGTVMKCVLGHTDSPSLYGSG
ncbi:hypothetical protein D3C80_1779960 [compost metagenome]